MRVRPGKVGARSGAAALVTTLVALSATFAHAGVQDPAAPHLVDGQWTGALDYVGTASVDGASGYAGGTGTLTIAVSGGRAEGTFSFLGSGSSVTPGGGSSQLTFGADGTLSGDADAPVLEPTAVSLTGEASFQGITVPIDFSGSTAPVPLHITTASCEQVSGTYAQEAQAEVNAQGIAATFTGFFTVVRSKSAPPGTADTLNALLNELDAALVTGQTSGGILHDSLLKTLAKAEDFAASIPGNAKCGLPGTEAFQLAISAKVVAVLEQILPLEGNFTTPQLVELMYAGVQAGAIGTGAADQAEAQKILDQLEVILTARLQDAIAANDAVEIDAIKVAAITFGFQDLADLAGGL